MAVFLSKYLTVLLSLQLLKSQHQMSYIPLPPTCDQEATGKQAWTLFPTRVPILNTRTLHTIIQDRPLYVYDYPHKRDIRNSVHAEHWHARQRLTFRAILLFVSTDQCH